MQTLLRPRALLAVLAIASTAPAPHLRAQRPAPGPAFPALPESAPPGTGAIVPCLDDVEGDVLCGRFRVLERPAAPAGRAIDLAFVVLKALDGRGRSDAVTRFHGGPGAATTHAAAAIARLQPELRRSRDILLVDHRGTGASAALSCALPWPGGVASRFGTVFPLDHATACRDSLAKRADLTQYTTVRAMDDLAALSAWLGYDRLNLLGFSYGTREAQVFLRRHPARTRTVVLNGVAPVDRPLYVHHARYLQAALEHLYDECDATPACVEAFPDLRGVAADVFRRVREDPPRVRAGRGSVRFGAGDLAYALRGLLYGQAGRIPAALHAARAGDWQTLADFYLARQAWVAGVDPAPGYHFSVLCAEDVRRTSERDVIESTAGTFMGRHLVDAYAGVCDLWPAAHVSDADVAAAAGDVPALLLSGERDPVTPPDGAERVAERLANALHVVVPNGGHGQEGECVDAMVLRLVERGSLAGLDTGCVGAGPPTAFEIPERRSHR